MTWFRLDDDVVNDPKVQSLPPILFKAWINILCLANKGGGVLPDLDGVAFGLRITETKAKFLMSALKEAGLIDEEDGVSTPHNWSDRQRNSDVSTGRVKRFRERKLKRVETVSPAVTPPADETVQKERKKERAANAASKPLQDPDADLFRRGREVLGKEAGSLVAKLKKAKGGNISLARAALEAASTKDNPREYLGRIINGAADPNSPELWTSGIPGVT